jgi:hypothetical protein
MKKTQSNYLNMLNAVIRHFDDNTNLWNDIPLVVNEVNKLKQTGIEINAVATKQRENDPTGHTSAKEQVRDKLETLIYRTGTRLRIYARLINDDVTKAQLRFSQSSLDRMKHNELLICARVVVAACEKFLPELSDYQIDQATINELNQTIEQLVTLYAERDVVVDQRIEVTSGLNRLFAAARNQLKVLDDLVDAYLDDDTFIETYFITRRIHDLRGKKTNPKN